MEVWVAFTLLAVVMQGIRTAGQKKIVAFISPMATTLVRYLFGLPVALIYLVYLLDGQLNTVTEVIANGDFILYASMAAVAQILATFWLVKVLSFRNFAVGTTFAKTEALQTALLGVLFFSAYLSVLGWLAVIIGMFGIVVISLPNKGQAVQWQSIYYGCLSGIAFAFTSLWLREASLSLNVQLSLSAAFTLAYMVSLQTLLCFIYVYYKERAELKKMLGQLKLAVFVGVTSALGSIGWFTAMTYQNPAIVKSLGQIEIVITLLITYLFFKEKISVKEYLGMFLIVASVVLLLWV
ncbi:MAG: DMT family transporter [Oceanospirillaceae bacterium]|nr:DMT family transporter [Oceanospirillaceae bacterium]